jgi:uncharacterized membrane protein YhhN
VKPAFLGGIGAFLIGQLMYLGAFLYATSVLAHTAWWIYLTLLLLIGYGVVIFLLLKESLGTMKIPVIAYLVVILAMMFGALTLLATPDLIAVQTSWICVVGAGCFIISDTINAWEKFKKPFPYIRAIIMFTYLMAQLFIIQGFL